MRPTLVRLDLAARPGRSPHDLQGVLDQFHAVNVLCIGDVMVDRFMYGEVGRVSPEAPVPILSVTSHEEMIGGVGNVARNVAALGAHAVLIAVTGDDEAGRRIRELAEAEEHVTHRLVIDRDRPSTMKTRFVAHDQQLMRSDEESTAPISGAVARDVKAAIENEMARASVVVLSDYTKGVLTDEILRFAIEQARLAGVPVIADPKRADLSAYSGVNVLKPNRAELEMATQLPCETDEQVDTASRITLGKIGAEAIMATRSADGMSLIRPGFEALHLPAKATKVVDVSGAGDTVVATAAVAIAAGASLPDASEIANVAGGIVVSKIGTAVVTRQDLGAGLLASETSPAEAKILSLDSALNEVQRWRKQHLSVGFTNGCFDLLHPGHLSLLNEARASCDRLIVAINSDSSVKRLKGETRPVQNESARALVLASLAMVDMVLIFSDETPIPLLEVLEPDVLVKGGDYTLEEVVGAELVQSYGGQVKLATHVRGHSSTQVISKMSRRPVPKSGPSAGTSR